MMSIPILLIAHSRPKTLIRQLDRIEILPSTNVVISIDGPRPEVADLQKATILVAEKWARSTHHRVNLMNQKMNLGIYEHLPKAMESFFSKFDYGAILEDDIEFSPQLFDIFQAYREQLVRGDYWSVCGHNPLKTNSPFDLKQSEVKVYPSNFHSIWGWATSASNAGKFIDSYHLDLKSSQISEVLEQVAKLISGDPFLRRAFVLTWTRKLSGWNLRRSQSGWDTRWVFEAWHQSSLSLISGISLSREELSQNEGQTHPHSNKGAIWVEEHKKKFDFTLSQKSRSLDIKLLSIWGIRRKYSWLFCFRINRQLKGLIK